MFGFREILQLIFLQVTGTEIKSYQAVHNGNSLTFRISFIVDCLSDRFEIYILQLEEKQEIPDCAVINFSQIILVLHCYLDQEFDH